MLVCVHTHTHTHTHTHSAVTIVYTHTHSCSSHLFYSSSLFSFLSPPFSFFFVPLSSFHSSFLLSALHSSPPPLALISPPYLGESHKFDSHCIHFCHKALRQHSVKGTQDPIITNHQGHVRSQGSEDPSQLHSNVSTANHNCLSMTQKRKGERRREE